LNSSTFNSGTATHTKPNKPKLFEDTNHFPLNSSAFKSRTHNSPKPNKLRLFEDIDHFPLNLPTSHESRFVFIP
jgi:hypothetical protein